MQPTISLAPLQGYTDYIFRNTFSKFFKGIDLAYSPYIRIEKGEIRNSKLRDIQKENNTNIKLIPQILTNKTEEFIQLSKLVSDLDYEEVNWNLGCPFPMVARHNLGSGMLNNKKQFEEILDKVMNEIKCKLSIKMRLGYDNENDILELLPILNKYDLAKIIIHPRTGIQQYKGDINKDIFEQCLPLTKHQIVYNGDINSIEDYKCFNERFPNVNEIMIGRGLITNPFLAMDIKGINFEGNKKQIFKQFHGELLVEYSNLLNGDTQILKRMQSFWEYFSLSFSDPRKTHKKIKKASNASKYINAVNEIFNEYEWKE